MEINNSNNILKEMDCDQKLLNKFYSNVDLKILANFMSLISVKSKISIFNNLDCIKKRRLLLETDSNSRNEIVDRIEYRNLITLLKNG